MEFSTQILDGVVHGNTITVSQPLGLADGEAVRIVVSPLRDAQDPALEQKVQEWEQSEDAREHAEFVAWNRKLRQLMRPPITE
ncbi:MAG: hypothetical protein SFX18_13415 [Pirellulales bacterium]|nr:hypothetical protein [Pirellulales bacterium]